MRGLVREPRPPRPVRSSKRYENERPGSRAEDRGRSMRGGRARWVARTTQIEFRNRRDALRYSGSPPTRL